MSFRRFTAAAGLAAGLSTSLNVYAQNLPELLMKVGEEKYCVANYKDLKGASFSGVVRIFRRNENTFDFYVMQEHETYKAPNKKIAHDYGTPRAVLSISGPKMGDSPADVVTVDNETSFGNEDPKKSQITDDKMRFVNDVFACALKAEYVK